MHFGSFLLPAAASHFRHIFEDIAGNSGIIGSVILLKLSDVHYKTITGR